MAVERATGWTAGDGSYHVTLPGAKSREVELNLRKWFEEKYGKQEFVRPEDVCDVVVKDMDFLAKVFGELAPANVLDGITAPVAPQSLTGADVVSIGSHKAD